MGWSQLVAFFHAATGGVMDKLLEAFVREMAVPMWLGLVFWYAVQAIRIMSGSALAETGPHVMRRSIGMFFVVCAATSIDFFNRFVKGFFWGALPNKLTQIASDAGLSGGAAGAMGLTLPGNFGTDLEVIWAETVRAISVIYGSLGSVLSADFYIGVGGILLTIAAAVVGITVSLFVYVLSDFLLSLVIGIAPPFMALALFDYTRPFFDRWVGKAIALILVKLVAIVTLQMVLQCDMVFLEILRNGPDVAANAGIMQKLIALAWIVVLMGVGAIAMIGGPYLAYHLAGSGGSVTFLPSGGIGGPSFGGRGSRGGGGNQQPGGSQPGGRGGSGPAGAAGSSGPAGSPGGAGAAGRAGSASYPAPAAAQPVALGSTASPSGRAPTRGAPPPPARPTPFGSL